MFKALYNHVNNIIEKYLQIYDHILIYLQWIKKDKSLYQTTRPVSIYAKYELFVD